MPPSRQIEKVELFLLTSESEFSYKGLCKADINLGPKVLVVKQNDRNKTTIEIPFYYPFVMHKNILCHVSPTKLHDIVLVFSTNTTCKDVYDILFKYQVKKKLNVENATNLNGLIDRIIIPLSNEVFDNPNVSESTKDCIVQILRPKKAASMEDVKDIFVKSELSEPAPRETASTSPTILQMPPVKLEMESELSRKRKNNKTKDTTTALETIFVNKKCKTEVPDEVPAIEEIVCSMENNDSSTKRFLNSTEYEIQTYCKKGTKIQKQKLIIYCSPEKDLCYSYYFEAKSKRFNCEKCHEKNRYVVAHLRDGNDGVQFIELGLLTHICTPILYTPAQTYDALGTMGLGSILPPLSGTLNIELNNMILPGTSTCDKRNTTCEIPSTFHESLYSDDTDLSNITIKLKTEIMEAAKNLKKDKASAILAPNIVNQTSRILKPADYELRNYFQGVELKQRLIVFYPDNRNFCFPYTYETANRRFVCARCRRNKRLVVAHVRHHSNGDEYIELGLLNHLCPPLSYNISTPLQNDLVGTIESLSDNISSSEMPDISSESSTSSLRNSESPFAAGVTSAGTNDNETEALTSQSPLYELQMVNKNGKRKPQLLVFPYSDKQLAYYYYFDTKCNYFICGKCRKRLHYVTARLQKDVNGENSVKLNGKPHICLLMPYKSADE